VVATVVMIGFFLISVGSLIFMAFMIFRDLESTINSISSSMSSVTNDVNEMLHDVFGVK